MSDLNFNAGQEEFNRFQRQSQEEVDMTARLIRAGIAADRKSAEFILLGITVFALLVGVFFFRGLLTRDSAEQGPLDMLPPMQQGGQFPAGSWNTLR